MWVLLDRLARPSLTRQATLCALALNDQALQRLRGGRKRRAGLGEVLEATAACWRVFRPALAKSRWREVKHSLAAQRRARERLSVQPKARRRLERSLQRQSAWLGELAAVPPPEAVLLDGLARLYHEARRSCRKEPGSRRARRHARRWLLAEELLLAGAGHTSGDAGRRAAARFESLGADGFAATTTTYRRALPWRLFLALAPEPERG